MSELRLSFVFNGTPTIIREDSKQTLRQAVDSSMPPTGPKRYERIRVLLLQWEDDDIGVHDELEALELWLWDSHSEDSLSSRPIAYIMVE